MPFNSEEQFENALIEMLSKKGWEKEVLRHPSEKDLLQNWANILYDNNNTIDRLNGQRLTEGEMQQLIEQINTLRTPQMLNGFINGRTVSVKRDNPADTLHFSKEITLKIFDPHEIAAGQSRYQIVKQPHFASLSPLLSQRRGDLTLLINGMPVIHIELKKSGIPVSQAYNQIEKYSREGIFSGMFQLIQIFVAMNPEETVYFANPGPDGHFNKDFYFHWADFNNVPQNDWKDIATYLLSIPMAHQLIGYYTIADRTDGVLKVLRSYQYFAVRAIYDKVAKHRDWHDTDHQLGGYIWHTTGSGKTMSSFKAAQLIADSGNADKVVFVIDRIELGTQSAREYRNFSQEDEAIQETENTDVLIGKLKSSNVADTLIVSSIQKLGIVAEGNDIRPADLKKINQKRIVFIVDECHRSTFGETFQQIKATFPTAIFFGFTGTPIQDENQRNQSTTTDIFGDELHRYSIADGIRDGNVLGFDPYKVLVYKDKDLKTQVALSCAEASSVEEAMKDPDKAHCFNHIMALPMAGHRNEDGTWISGIEDMLPNTQYSNEEYMNAVVDDILDGWLVLSKNYKFHAIFTTTSIPQAINYYRLFKEKAPEGFRVTALFDPSLLNDNPDKVIFKETALAEIIDDYNRMYGQHFTVPTHAKFKKDLSNRLAHKRPYIGLEQPANRNKRLDLLIVVSQMLTGFDSKWVNTLYFDKVLEYADLIQAFSRTNRLYSHDEKPFGVIKYYNHPHTMEYNITEAVRLYSGNKPLGLFVSKLDVNLGGMNQKFKEIEQLFKSVQIENFSKLPEETALRGRFAQLFREYNEYLDAAKVQGFNWKKLTYICPNGEVITVNHDEIAYNTLVQRYKELFNSTGGGGGGGDDDVPYDLDPHISEIDTGKIDSDYMNHNFERYIKALEQPNVTEEELSEILNDLSTSFATLPQEEQKFAEIFLHDVQSANITLEPGKTFRDYITDYMTTEKDRRINRLAEVLGLNKALLQAMLNLQITEQNIDEFGRFSQLKQSVDQAKAKSYFEGINGETLSPFKVNIEVNKLLKQFILVGGFDIEEIQPATSNIAIYTQDDFEPAMAAEEFEYFKITPPDQTIIDIFGGESMILVGCYKTKKHLEWIMANNLYNIRLGARKGSLESEQAMLEKTKFLVIYNIENPNKVAVYEINGHREMTGKELLEIGYPNPNAGKNYMTFDLLPSSIDLARFEEEQLIQRLVGNIPNHINGAPVIIEP